jgi:hypothetical protein
VSSSSDFVLFEFMRLPWAVAKAGLCYNIGRVYWLVQSL